MPKGIKQFLFSVIVFHSVCAQAFQQNDNPNKLEKVFQHWDKSAYLPGETGWFKAYIVSDFTFSPYSTVLYTDLLDAENKVVKRVVSPILAGATKGHLYFPDSMKRGDYTIRAYTPLMLNYGYRYVFEKRIQIGAIKKSPQQHEAMRGLNVFFYPESGTLMTGHFNSIAFRARYENGDPALIKGSIVDDKGQYQAEVETYHDGRGSFEMYPEEGRSYALEIELENKQYTFPLPAHSGNGVLFKVRPHVKGLIFDLTDSLKPVGNLRKKIVGKMNGQVVFNMEIPEGKKNFKGIINTLSENLYPGILSLLVYDELENPVAERLVFIKKSEAQVGGGSITDPLSIQGNDGGAISLKLNEPFSGHLSIAVLDEKEKTDFQPSVFSYLLLTSDLPGYIENPDWYFQTTTDSSLKALDLLMLTNGFERYKKWDKKQYASGSPFKDPGFITIVGKVKDWVLTDTAKRVMLLVTAAGAANQMQYIGLDENGQFRMDSSIWFDHARLSFLESSGKKSRARAVELDHYSIDSMTSLSFFDQWQPSLLPRLRFEQKESDNPFAPSNLDSIKMLKEVVVGTRKKSTTAQVNEAYTSGLFSMDAVRTIDLINGTDILVQENIFEYLKMRVPGISIVEPNYENPTMPSIGDDPLNDPSGYRVYYRQQATVSSLGNIPMAVYLNEVQTSPSVIAAIPANQIALVKVFSTFAAAPGGGGGGALAIYTRKPDPNERKADEKSVVYEGFTPLKNFTPDKPVTAEEQQDTGRTLFWMPDVVAEKLKQTFTIPSRGIDRSKPINIRVQGMGIDGKFISINKVLPPK